LLHVDLKDSFHLRITRELGDFPEHSFDACLFVPGDLALTPEVLEERTFYQQGIQIHRTYQSAATLEPLVRSRLIRRMSRERGRPDPQYRLSLSLYGFQYVTAMEQAVHKILQSGSEDLREELGELIELSSTILGRLRRNRPEDGTLALYFTNIDNYVSWLTEQQFLKLAAELEFQDNELDLKELLMRIARRESKYRDDLEYNSARVSQDSIRLSNKMRLLRRLIEHPVSMRRVGIELGEREQKLVRAGVTAVVMSGVSFLVLRTRDVLGDITAIFILVLALLYAVRELFREDLQKKLWNWLRKGRPKWRYQFVDVNSEQTVGTALEWFDYKKYEDLPEHMRNARQSSTQQREETVMRFRSYSKMLPARFLSGYAGTRETLTFDMSLLQPLMNQSTYPLYSQQDSQVLREDVERRYVFNLITCERVGEKKETIERWKITMNYSRILSVEKSEA